MPPGWRLAPRKLRGHPPRSSSLLRDLTRHAPHVESLLPRPRPGAKIGTRTSFRTGLEKLLRIMTDANPLCRRLLTVGVTAMALVVLALSTASRGPYTGTNSVSWHTCKASRMSPASGQLGSES